MSPNLLILLAVLLAIGVVAGAILLVPQLFRRSQVDRWIKAHERALELAADAYAEGKPGLAEAHMERARLIAEHLGRHGAQR